MSGFEEPREAIAQLSEANFGDLYGTQTITFLDGGMGTTLEDIFHVNIADTPLWSAKPIDKDPESIIGVHLAFLRAGARTILTSTYQCAYTTFDSAGYSRDDATRIMFKSVGIAKEARRRFCDERKDIGFHDIRIALSLGPFGATLFPAQEFDGFYPPPYGPKAFSNEGENKNSFGNDEQKIEKSIEALTEFHLERLTVFASDRESWDAIDCVAFETVPLTREIKAIRKAMRRLGEDVAGEGRMKPWWISTVWPGGRYPERRNGEGEHLAVSEVINAAFGSTRDTGMQLPTPNGIGINCTALDYLQDLLLQFEREIDSQVIAENLNSQKRPWLVLYPNGGEIYDTVSRMWIKPVSEEMKKGNVWGRQLSEVVRRADESRRWGGIVVGGCCKAGPADIEVLVEALHTP